MKYSTCIICGTVKCMNTKCINEAKALHFAGKYGIACYSVIGDKMYYREFFGNEEWESEVNLNTMKETRKQIN